MNDFENEEPTQPIPYETLAQVAAQLRATICEAPAATLRPITSDEITQVIPVLRCV